MKSLKAIVATIVLFAVAAQAQTTKPPPQRADIAAPKMASTTQPNARFMSMHEKFVQQAKAGNIDLLFLGDSITEGWMGKGKDVWQKYYGDKNAANFGIGGDKTQHVLWRIENGELEGIHPKVCVLMIGTNNVGSNPPEQIADGIEKIVKTVRDKTGAKVLLLGVFPRGRTAESGATARQAIAKINAQISKLDDGTNIRYLDITEKFLDPDKSIPADVMPDAPALHPNAKGYEIWAEAMNPLLTDMMK